MFYSRLPKNIFLLVCILVVIIICLLLFLYITIPSSKINQTTIPIPTRIEVPRNTSVTAQTKKALDKDVKNLHWLNNNELAYTFFDTQTKNNMLAKTNGTTETILLQNETIKLSELFWSKNNKLLIFDYGNPYRTYLFQLDSPIQTLPLVGYGYSWSPDNNSLFYIDIDKDQKETPSLYNTTTKAKTPLTTILPAFQSSMWIDDNRVLLYFYNLETGRGKIYLYNSTLNTITGVSSENTMFPLRSPDNKYISFLTDKGLFVWNENADRLIYPLTHDPIYVSYGWISNSQILLFDSQSNSELFIIDVSSGNKTNVLKDLSLDKQQRMQISVSPDRKTLVLATEKNGLWFTKNPLLATGN